MRRFSAITNVRGHGELARAVYRIARRSANISAVAVQDSLGLWHSYPGGRVMAQVKEYNLRLNKRLVCNVPNAARNRVLSLLHEAVEIINVKLEALDLRERFARLEMLATAEMKEALRHEKELRKHLKRSAEEKIRFFSTYSHDLKTPLSLLTMPLENLAVHDDRLPPALRLQLEKIKIAIYNVLRTVGHSLDAARLMTQSRRQILLPYDFSAFVRHVAEVYSIVFESYGMSLETEIDGEIIAEIDPIQMEKVINNLLSNSIKHNLPGCTTRIKLSRMAGKAQLTISDNGLGGMVALPESGRRPVAGVNPWVLSSHGYGLGIVRELLKLNRARLRIKSEKGVGTTVSILLPAQDYLAASTSGMRMHNFYHTMHEVELLASERTQLSRRKKTLAE